MEVAGNSAPQFGLHGPKGIREIDMILDTILLNGYLQLFPKGRHILV